MFSLPSLPNGLAIQHLGHPADLFTRYRGNYENCLPAIDVSPANDWSQVKVWYDPNRDLGGSTYAVHGFIYPDASARMLAASGVTRL